MPCNIRTVSSFPIPKLQTNSLGGATCLSVSILKRFCANKLPRKHRRHLIVFNHKCVLFIQIVQQAPFHIFKTWDALSSIRFSPNVQILDVSDYFKSIGKMQTQMLEPLSLGYILQQLQNILIFNQLIDSKMHGYGVNRPWL